MALLPVHDPRFSLREAAKHCILLEDHLQSPQKRCGECIRKHMLAIEGYLEEACGLDAGGGAADPGDAQRLRELALHLEAGRDPRDAAQQIRALRKRLATSDEGGNMRRITQGSLGHPSETHHHHMATVAGAHQAPSFLAGRGDTAAIGTGVAVTGGVVLTALLRAGAGTALVQFMTKERLKTADLLKIFAGLTAVDVALSALGIAAVYGATQAVGLDGTKAALSGTTGKLGG